MLCSIFTHFIRTFVAVVTVKYCKVYYIILDSVCYVQSFIQKITQFMRTLLYCYR